jgi:gamma-glutamyltranspeptidase / glutathione hydrolase
MTLTHYPYPSRRSALLASNGVVATSQPLAARAGLSMLEKGGNAVDAALATAIALTVLEPTSNGIGSDAFAIVWDGEGLHGLNGSGRWPKAWDAEGLRGQGHAEVPERGWASVSVPGAPAAWHDLHQRFARLSIAELTAPAIAYAEQGFPVSPVISQLWRNAAPIFLGSDDAAMAGWRQVFSRDGVTPAAAERWYSPGHAACLRTLSTRGFRDFYDGEVAEQLLAYSNATGGVISSADLTAHSSEWVDPIRVSYRGHDIWEIPPNGQGIAALIALGILQDEDLASLAHGGERAWHLQIEAMKLAFADAYRYVADPAHVDVPVAGLLDPDYLASRRALIGDEARVPEAGRPPGGGTVYLCTADRDGMMVSFIQSNYHGFGSGVVVPELGISLQNRASGFTLEPGHANEAAGGKRPRHTIIPAFITRDGQALGPFGVMGGEMQPQGHVQVVSAMLDHGLNPQAALDAPRWQLDGGLDVAVEPRTDERLLAALAARGHRPLVAADSLSFGRGQIILRLEDGVYAAGSEPRADGAALGY